VKSKSANRALLAALLLASATPALADEARSLEELRNTVINLLEALVQKGVMTREQAEKMVSDAQSKAEQSAADRATKDAAEKDAVHVAYVPEIVKEEIKKQVAADLKDKVTDQVVAQAKEQQWGVPGALPEWIKSVKLYGDVRSRAEGIAYADDNARNAYLDFNTVNNKGGVGKAGDTALLNVSEDRNRLVGRLRFGATVQLGNAFSIDTRLTSGTATTPVSTNQTLGNYGARWTLNVDKAAVLWNPLSEWHDRELDLRFGRFSNPFVTTSELIWDNDVTFEGLSATYAMDLWGRDLPKMERGLFLTVGAFPLQEVELSTKDKWLYAAQLGSEFWLGRNAMVRVTGGYFDYRNIVGVRNSPDSTLQDFTAPKFLQKGNTLYDIRNDTDTSTNLYALAGEYRIANANVTLDLAVTGPYHAWVTGEYAKNVGWDTKDVLALTGKTIQARTVGYDFGVGFGNPLLKQLWDWRASLSYRYVERDAVLDAFTDSDFHLGGTDAKGYQFNFDLGLARGAWLRLRYLSANEIDGPPLGIDVWQLDLNGQF
jgi:polyhydroxyalkanoate synthesis regulator phasin